MYKALKFEILTKYALPDKKIESRATPVDQRVAAAILQIQANRDLLLRYFLRRGEQHRLNIG
jgi:hypothetical protein